MSPPEFKAISVKQMAGMKGIDANIMDGIIKKRCHKTCAVVGCNARTKRMFRFPDPRKDYERCLKWIRACGREDFFQLPPRKLRNKVTCGIHFESSCFLWNRLSKNAVPSYNLSAPTTSVDPQKGNVLETAEEEERVDSVGPGNTNRFDSNGVLPGSSRVMTHTVQWSDCQPAARKGLKGNVLKIIKGSSVEEATKKAVYNAVVTLLKAIKQSRRWKARGKNRIEKIEHLVQSGVCQVLENLPAPLHAKLLAQMRNAGKKKSARRFSKEEKVIALSILKQSSKAYRYLAKLFLLPSIETFRKLISQIPLKAGISDNVFEELKERSELFIDEKSRYAILLFDEINLSPTLQYNPSMDVIEGFVDSGFSRNLNVANYATVWMLKGIHGVRPWKQPVAYSFCKGSNSVENLIRTFKEVVCRACQAGIVVVATVCDQESINCKAIQSLIDSSKRNAFQESNTLRHDVIVIDNNIIVPLFDPPHLLKYVRNNLLTKDLRYNLEDNIPRVAKWSHVEDLYFIDNSNVSCQDRVLQKLTVKHVIPNQIPKMKVKYCAQVFSRTVGSVMTLMSRNKVKSVCGTREMSGEGIDTARFIHFMNDIFDSVNNSVATSTKATDMIITDFMSFIKRKPADKKYPKVLHNWIRTLENFKFLKSYLCDLGFSEFTTRNFNQDALENFFGQIRQHGTRNTNPTCSAFHSYYRTLLLNSYSQLVCADINYESEESAGFLLNLKKYISVTPRTSTDETYLISLNYNVSSAPESIVQAAMQYVSRIIRKKRHICKFCLAIFYETNDFIEYSSMHSGCKFLISTVVSVCYGNISNVAHIPGVVTALELQILEYMKFDFICSEHGNEMTTYIISNPNL